MVGHPISAKCPRISVEESAVGQHQKEEMEEASSQKRWLCNELVWELCKEIPTAKTSDRILFTSRNMYAYLEPQFSKKLIYRDAIAFLKSLLNARKNIEIRIIVARNTGNEPIVVIKQNKWKYGEKIELETNKFRVQIKTGIMEPRQTFVISAVDYQFECAHLLYFIRLIAPLIKPIQFYLDIYSSNIPIAEKARFLNTQSDWIDSIALWDQQFSSEPICEALSKYNKLHIVGTISPANVSKIIHWLITNNPLEKYLVLVRINHGLALLIDELKKEFARATSKSRFVIRLELYHWLDEFTLRNEYTGERLELRRKNIEDEEFHTHTLIRSPNNEMHDSEDDCAELGTFVTDLCLR